MDHKLRCREYQRKKRCCKEFRQKEYLRLKSYKESMTPERKALYLTKQRERMREKMSEIIR
jgi:hypothetical protein